MTVKPALLPKALVLQWWDCPKISFQPWLPQQSRNGHWQVPRMQPVKPPWPVCQTDNNSHFSLPAFHSRKKQCLNHTLYEPRQTRCWQDRDQDGCSQVPLADSTRSSSVSLPSALKLTRISQEFPQQHFCLCCCLPVLLLSRNNFSSLSRSSMFSTSFWSSLKISLLCAVGFAQHREGVRVCC